jgi:hypothetical protein
MEPIKPALDNTTPTSPIAPTPDTGELLVDLTTVEAIAVGIAPPPLAVSSSNNPHESGQ